MNRFFRNVMAMTMALLAVACGQKKEEGAASSAAAPQQEKPQVKIERVMAQTVAQTETYTGTVEINWKNNVAPNAPSRNEKI